MGSTSSKLPAGTTQRNVRPCRQPMRTASTPALDTLVSRATDQRQTVAPWVMVERLFSRLDSVLNFPDS